MVRDPYGRRCRRRGVARLLHIPIISRGEKMRRDETRNSHKIEHPWNWRKSQNRIRLWVWQSGLGVSLRRQRLWCSFFVSSSPSLVSVYWPGTQTGCDRASYRWPDRPQWLGSMQSIGTVPQIQSAAVGMVGLAHYLSREIFNRIPDEGIGTGLLFS